MDKLIFLSSKILTSSTHKKLKIPLVFVSFAFIEGKLYKYKKAPYLNMPLGYNKNRDNRVIYGALYFCKDFDFYSNQLDAFHSCSASKLGVNHPYDLCHRVEMPVTPIKFDTIDQFTRLMYQEKPEIMAEVYIGNTKHPKIKKYTSTKFYHAKIKSGVDREQFIKLFMEVSKEWETHKN